MTSEQIKTVGALIRDETVTGANTATRVGGAIVGIGENLEQLESDIGTAFWESIDYTPGIGLVNSVTGVVDTTKADYRYAEIPLKDTGYTKLTFRDRVFGNDWGYGFIVNGVWQGWKGNNNGYRTIDVPEGATIFRCCWGKEYSNEIEGLKSQLVTDSMRILIEENKSFIDDLRMNVSEIFEKLGSEDFETIDYANLLLDNYVVDTIDGSFINSVGYYSIELPLNGNYTKLRFNSWGFMKDRGYGFIVNGTWTGTKTSSKIKNMTIDVPEGATIFRLSWGKNYTQKIEGAVNNGVFVNLQKQIISNVDSISNLQERINNIIEKMGTEDYVELEYTKGVGLVADGTGQVDTSKTDYRYYVVDLTNTAYSKIKFYSQYFANPWGYGFFFGDGSWFGYHGSVNGYVEIDIPDGAAEFRCCLHKNKDQLQEIYGLVYIDEYTNLQNQILDLANDTSKIDNLLYILKPFTLDVPDCSNIIPGLKVSELYALWDDLVTSYPTYLASTDIGYDQSGTFNMRMVTFGIPGIATKKVIVLANIHGRAGDSHIPAYLMYWLANYVLTNKSTSELAQYILSNFNFIIIPIGNPWGFENEAYGNVNGINLNRNFDAGFVANTTGSGDALSGVSAASEAETQNIQAVIDDNTDAWMFVDFHSHPEPAGNATWNRDMEQLLPMKNETLETQCAKIKEYGNLVGNDYITMSVASAYQGMAKNYADQCGIKRSLTIEAAASHPDEHWNSFGTKAMTAAARLFLSLLRFE